MANPQPPNYIADDIFVLRPPKQTLKAWALFWDCVNIYFLIVHSDVDDEHHEWRLYWVAGMALLRTVGHVLAKSDALTSEKHKAAVNELWNEWKSARNDNKIFWEFIEKERNNILKTYTFGATLIEDEDEYRVAYSDGDDAFGLFSDSLYWWRYQLMGLEERV